MREDEMHPLIDREKQKLARTYRRDNRVISLLSIAVSCILIAVLLFFNISVECVAFLQEFIHSRVFVIFIYFAGLYILYSIITMPLSFVSGYSIEHKYGFSTQSCKAWFTDWLKSSSIGLIIGSIVFEALYLITHWSPQLWWLWLSLIMIVFSVVLSNIFPVLIIPLFYKTTPLQESSLKDAIDVLCKESGISIQGVYSINLSSKSTKANAAVVGLGNTKRILLGDTFISDYSTNEVIAVLAHEIIHYKEGHVWWLIFWQATITVVMFFVLYTIHPYVYRIFGFSEISDIAAFPILILLFACLSFIMNPLGSGISRFYEKRADRGALELTMKADAFISVMAKFCNKQLALAYPHPIVEWFMYSHPSSGNRIKFAERWKMDYATGMNSKI